MRYLLPVLLVLAACGTKPAPAPVVCKSATTQACSCDHAPPSTQFCAADGTRWEACDCSPPHDAGPCEDATGDIATGCAHGSTCHSGTEAPYCGAVGKACHVCQEGSFCSPAACKVVSNEEVICDFVQRRDGTPCDGGNPPYPSICFYGECRQCGAGTGSPPCDYDAGP